MVPVSNGHVLRSMNVQRKTLGVDVIVEALCGTGGIIQALGFRFFYPELGDGPAMQQAIECPTCKQAVASLVKST
jgi:hypothetical protein